MAHRPRVLGCFRRVAATLGPAWHATVGRPLLVAVAAAALGLLAGPAVAQGQLPSTAYSRNELTQPYFEYSGTGAAFLLAAGDRDNGAFHVSLPFAFPYFGRIYRHAWLSTNGSVLFADTQLASAAVTPLTLPVGHDHLHEAIHVLRTDLIGGSYRPQAFSAHVIDGNTRIVFQWKGVVLKDGERLTELNFQVHLYSDGRIRFWYGPERVVLADTQDFVSGLVNADGTDAVAGFGSTLGLQTTRPQPNRVVEFAPVDLPAAPDAVFLVPSAASLAPVTVLSGQSDCVVAALELRASAAGGNVSSIRVSHPAFPIGTTLSLALVADEGEHGVYEPTIDTPLAAAGVVPGTVETQLALPTQAVNATSPLRRYLLLATATSLPDLIEGPLAIRARAGDVGASVPVYGGLRTAVRTFAAGPVIEAHVSTLATGRVARAGDANVTLASLELRNRPGLTGATLLSFEAKLLFAGLSAVDVSQARLYRDMAGTGTLDPGDPLLAQASPSGTSVMFAGLGLSVPVDEGLHLLVVADLASGIAGPGFVGFDGAGSLFTYSPTGSGPAQTRVTGQATTVRVLGTASRVLVQRNHGYALTAIPAQPGQSNVPALAFTLQTASGSASVSSLTFTAPLGTAGVQAARLYIDNGAQQGRWDPADTPIGTGTVTAGEIEFSGLGNILLDDSPRAFLLVLDWAATAAAGPRRFDLDPADVASGLPVTGSVVTGTEISVGQGLASAGVDVAISFAHAQITFGGDQMVPLAFISLLPRAGGGVPPNVLFSLVDSTGGVTDNTLSLIPFLDANGSGTLDATDPDLVGLASPLNVLSVVPLSQGAAATATQPRVFMIGIARERAVDGACQIVFRGVSGGTNPQMVGWPNSQRLTVTVANAAVPQPGRRGSNCGALPDGGGRLGALAPVWVALVLLAAAWHRGRRPVSFGHQRQAVPAQPAEGAGQ